MSSKSSEKPLAVCKLGGSLLDLPGLAAVVRRVLDQRPNHSSLIVVGGGPTAESVRGWDRIHHLGDETAHWLALEAMRFNESLLSRLMPELRLVRNAKQVAAAASDGVPGLLCADCFVRWGESIGHPALLRTWRTTSDSIAAWTAGILAAEELVLLKSAPLPQDVSSDEAAQAGLVDEEFTKWARPPLRVSWVDVRGVNPLIESWPM